MLKTIQRYLKSRMEVRTPQAGSGDGVQSYHFSDIDRIIGDVLKLQNFSLTDGFINNFLSVLSDGFNYCEEGESYSPEIMVTHSFSEIRKSLVGCQTIPIKTGDLTGDDMAKCLKPIIPFCENGWIIYIDINEKNIQYGIVKAFTGIEGFSAIGQIFDEEKSVYSVAGLAHFQYANKTDLLIQPLDGKETIISLGFYPSTYSTSSQDNLLDACTCELDGESVADVKQSFKKFFSHCFRKIHGTIIVVVDDGGDSVRQGYLKDGIWLEKSIDLAGSADLGVITKGRDSDQFFGLCGVMRKMIDFDGITVLSVNGQVLAYNCFVHEGENKKNVAGGARRRAYASLCSCGDASIKGAYFQSQDGHSEYQFCGGNNNG